MSNSSQHETLVLLFQRALSGDGSIDAALDGLLSATDSRAVGLWRVEGETLRQIGFRAATDMPTEVSSGFAAATTVVPLSETGLGIVKAVHSGKAAIAVVDPNSNELGASASWLAKFEARSSLAVPIFAVGKISGVLAVSTAHKISTDDDNGRLMLALADALGAFPAWE